MHENSYTHGYSENKIVELTAKNAMGLLFLTLAYFTVEIIINYTIYSQLAWGSNRLTIEVMETWGRAVTGIGIALILSKLYFSNTHLYTSQLLNEAPKSSFVVFIVCCIFTVPFSFWVQGAVIESIVDHSDQQQRNKAILVLATKGTLVPHYDTSMASYPTGNLEMDLFDKAIYPFRNKESATSHSYVTNEALFMSLAGKCAVNAESALGIKKSTDKALFGYTVMGAKINESESLSLLDGYYRCLYANDDYLMANSKSIGYPVEPLERMYKSQYDPASKRYMHALRSLGSNRLTLYQINKSWSDGIEKQLGFPSDIKPKLGFNAFVSNPDVKRSYLSRIDDVDESLYPFNTNFKNTVRSIILKDLPAAAIPSYRGASGVLLGGNRSIDESNALDSGKGAYKAIVMPIVGLLLSAFFLITNMIFSVYSWTDRIAGKKAAVAVLAGLTIWFFFAPLLASFFSNTGIALADQSYMIKWIYYHENNLSKIYAWFV